MIVGFFFLPRLFFGCVFFQLQKGGKKKAVIGNCVPIVVVFGAVWGGGGMESRLKANTVLLAGEQCSCSPTASPSWLPYRLFKLLIFNYMEEQIVFFSKCSFFFPSREGFLIILLFNCLWGVLVHCAGLQLSKALGNQSVFAQLQGNVTCQCQRAALSWMGTKSVSFQGGSVLRTVLLHFF